MCIGNYLWLVQKHLSVQLIGRSIMGLSVHVLSSKIDHLFDYIKYVSIYSTFLWMSNHDIMQNMSCGSFINIEYDTHDEYAT